MNKRLVALQCLQSVLQDKRSLPHVLSTVSHAEKSYIAMLNYGVLRVYWSLAAIANALLSKPFKPKDQDIFHLILLGLFELQHTHTAQHAVLNETVNAAKALKKPWAAGVVNAVLRRFLREKDALKPPTDLTEKYNHPDWMIQRIQQDWPEDWQSILTANNQQAPMCLRVNALKTDMPSYLSLLQIHHIDASAHPTLGIQLKNPCDVTELPGFTDGLVSVQDPSAQRAACLLNPSHQDRVLDACAAPGGKTGHLLELAPDCDLTALEIDANRIQKITENLTRLQLSATVLNQDANDLTAWWDNTPFHKILCDAPCSASGVIRRHPDSKHLRRADDIPALQKQQLQLLNTLWQTLAPNGQLLYCTCSIFKAENDDVIQTFLSTHENATCMAISNVPGTKTVSGIQILPGNNDQDGFYYSLLTKTL